MGLIDGLKTNGQKVRNRGGHIVDAVFAQLPQKISQTTEKVFSAETANQIGESFEDVKKHFSSLFDSIKEEDTINLPDEDITAAVISNIVYDDPFGRPRRIETYDLIEDYNSIEYCLYRDKKKGKCILGFRGTEFTEAKDYVSDVNILIGTHAFNERFQTSLDIYDKIRDAFKDDILAITGHSLGGTICYLIAQKKDPDRTVVFNPGSSVNPTFALMLKDTQFQEPWTKRVFTYRILGDIVSTLSVIGYTRTFRKASVNPKELHTVANFMPSNYTKQ